jgi:membrane-associated phospholipid phosphatase
MTVPITRQWFARRAGAHGRTATRGRGGRSCRPVVERLEGLILTAGDVVLEWNQHLLDAAAVDSAQPSPGQAGPGRAARAFAIESVAVYDAVNGTTGQRYTPYAVRERAPRGTSVDAAAAEAAYVTLSALYPRQQSAFRAELRATLRRVPDGPVEIKGILYGRQVARAVLRRRQGDGSELTPSYTPGTDPGHWGPDPLNPGQKALGPGWGAVRPFALAGGAQFRAAPPPALGSAGYAAAFDEVKRLGGDGLHTATSRTPEQTQIGLFWGYDGPGLGTPPRLYNQAVRTVALARDNSMVQSARLFALVNIAMADAGIAAWDTKYTYDLWRPIAAIRRADTDGNPATEADPGWTPLGAPGDGAVPDFTPPFPAYTSGHAAFGAAAFRVLADFYGRDDIPFTLTSDEFDGVRRPRVTRSYTSFSQAAAENGASRIYLGIHWQFDNVAGQAQGRDIADYVFRHFLTPTGRDDRPLSRDTTTVAAHGRGDGPGPGVSQAFVTPGADLGTGSSALSILSPDATSGAGRSGGRWVRRPSRWPRNRTDAAEESGRHFRIPLGGPEGQVRPGVLVWTE